MGYCFLNNCEKDFITSDNPVLTLNSENSFPAIIYLPIHPKWSIIALKRASFKISKD
ncbi:MAG: hypothetical protein ACJA1Z_002653 [Patiriisocius sp.]